MTQPNDSFLLTEPSPDSAESFWNSIFPADQEYELLQFSTILPPKFPEKTSIATFKFPKNIYVYVYATNRVHYQVEVYKIEKFWMKELLWTEPPKENRWTTRVEALVSDLRYIGRGIQEYTKDVSGSHDLKRFLEIPF